MKSTSSSSTLGHHHSNNRLKPSSNVAEDEDGNESSPMHFEPIYRPSSYNDNDSGEQPTSKSGHPMTIRTSEGLEQLEKNNYDKQLLKTLKNLMVTGGKRHKLDFEDKEEGEIHRIQTKGKIPEKYLRQFPSEDSRYHHSHPHSSDQDLDNNNNNSDSDDNNQNESYNSYDSRTDSRSISSASNEDMADELNDDIGSDERYDELPPP
ncbi:hypothetical protein BLA29_010773, partial [Euroglyphus maynei]